MNCPKCSHINPKTAKFCSFCGSLLIFPKRSFLAKHKGTFIAVALVITFVILPIFAVYNFINSISSDIERSEKEDAVISGSGEDKIALINIDGIIVETEPQRSLGSVTEDVTTARGIKKILRKIDADENVKAVLLRVNSPGGSAVASEEIYRDLLDFKKKSGKKLVAYFSDTAASGAYYISMAADQIVANPSTITGSIGVIISYFNFKDIAEKYGVKNIVYKSGAHKDIISEFRDPTDEEKAIIQGIISDTYDNFVKAVSSGRALPESQVQTLADGRIYSAKQAVELKLVDQTGTLEDAIDATLALADLEKASVVEFGQPGFFDLFLGSIGGKFNFSLFPSLQNYFDVKPGIKVLYLYTP